MIAVTVNPKSPSTPPKPGESPKRPSQPDLSVLEDRAPPWARLSRGTTFLTLLCGLLFIGLSYQPLWHTDLWGHLSYGRWIVQHRSLPATEPLLPLCQGVPFADTAWLSQVAGFETIRVFGVAGIQFLYAFSITICTVLLAGMVVLRSGSALWAAVAVIAFGALDYQQLIIVRPQLAGLACFVVTLAILTAQKWRRAYWIVLPALFALWANLHGSFLMGLFLIGCFALGRAIDVIRRTGSLRAVAGDPDFRRPALLLELCAAAVLLNPYGLSIYFEVFKVAANPNLRDLIEWDALTLRMMQGKVAAASLVALFVVYRLSPRRATAAEILSLVVLGLATCWSSRIIVWWSPVAAYYLAMHGAAATRRLLVRIAAPHPRSGLWTVATVGLIWISVAYTPFGLRLLHGGPKTPDAAERQFRHSVSSQTPIDAVAYLHEHPPQGLVFNTYEWGDYLLWAGPPNLQCFVASHAHLVPVEVWQDYLRIALAAEGWDDKLDRYGVNAVIVDDNAQADLIRRLKKFPEVWTLEHDDGVAAIFVRKNPI